jgi:hypothetical protein
MTEKFLLSMNQKTKLDGECFLLFALSGKRETGVNIIKISAAVIYMTA